MEQVIDPTHVLIWLIVASLIFVGISVLIALDLGENEEVREEALALLFALAFFWPVAIPLLLLVGVALCPFYLTLYVKRKLSNEPRY
jgi:hypothetical protein